MPTNRYQGQGVTRLFTVFKNNNNLWIIQTSLIINIYRIVQFKIRIKVNNGVLSDVCNNIIIL